MPTERHRLATYPEVAVGYAVHVSLPDLDQLVADMQSFGDRAVVLGLDLDANVRRLHGEWQGTAADAHHAAHHEWRRRQRRLLADLAAARHAAHVARRNYEAAVTANLAMWR